MREFSLLLLFWGCCGSCRGVSPSPLGADLTSTGVGGCVDSSMCPDHAICHNITSGRYYCECKQGYQPSNRQNRFVELGVTCQDINECSQNPTPCGPHSECRNIRGRYKCSCLPGFSSPTGNNWVPGKPGNFSCTDIDECKAIQPCPEHAICHNTVGSYHCVCKQGFDATSGQVLFKGLGELCEDIDECSKNRTICGANSVCGNTVGGYNCSCMPGFLPTGVWTHRDFKALKCTDVDECSDRCPRNSVCTNTPGSYFCACHPGFAPSHGQPRFQHGEADCHDTDECLLDPNPCGPNSICTNTLGSYSCTCALGFWPESSQGHGNIRCKKAPFKCRNDVDSLGKWEQQCHAAAMDPQDAAYCRLMTATLGVLDSSCENKTTAATLKMAADNLTSVLEQTSKWSSNFTREEASTLATALLESTDSSIQAALLLPSASGNHSQTIRTPGLDLESKVVVGECQEKDVLFNLKAKGDAMTISCSTVEESGSTGRAGVAFVSFVGLESLMDERFSRDLWDFSARGLKMNTRVVSGILTGEKKNGFGKDVLYRLESIQPKQKHETPLCVSWLTDEDGGRWTHSGCSILNDSETHTVCRCRHITNLAVIMAPREVMVDFTLYVISHVGILLSLLCLALAVVTFLLCRSIRNHNTYTHAHLCACLFLAKLLFLIGFDKTDPQLGCSLIAGALHYLFLACFSWMLLEAITLFLTVRNLQVVNYFGTRHIRMLPLCVFGYGLPGLVVAISAGVKPSGYGTDNSCWLKKESGFVWSFLGPVCAIIVVNSILLTWTLCILRQKLGSVNTEVSTLRDTRLLTFKAFAQLFILGCSWVLGLFQIGSAAVVMAYLFTIINSFQGVLIFLIHCLLNRQVREQYRRWFCRQTATMSQSQTAGTVLMSTLSSSKMS